MSTRWGGSSDKGIWRTPRITKKELVPSQANKEATDIGKKQTKKWLVMMGIIIAGTILSIGVGLAIETAGLSLVATQVLNSVVTGTIDIATNLLADFSQGRMNKSNLFLTLMPILGVELLGKTWTIIKNAKRVKYFIKEVDKMTWSESIIGIVPNKKYTSFKFGKVGTIEHKVDSTIKDFIKQNPSMFLYERDQIFKNLKFSYKNAGQKNFMQKNIMKNMKERINKKKYEHKWDKMILWNKFGDESIFNEDLWIATRNQKGWTQFSKRKADEQMVKKVNESMEGGLQAGEKIAAKINQIRAKTMSRYGTGSLTGLAKGSSGWLMKKIGYKRELQKAEARFAEKQAISKGKVFDRLKKSNIAGARTAPNQFVKASARLKSIEARTLEKPVIKAYGYKDVIKHNWTKWDKLSEKRQFALKRIHTVLGVLGHTGKIIHSYTKFFRVLNPALLSRKLGRYAGQYAGKGVMKLNRILEKKVSNEKIKKSLNWLYRDIDFQTKQILSLRNPKKKMKEDRALYELEDKTGLKTRIGKGQEEKVLPLMKQSNTLRQLNLIPLRSKWHLGYIAYHDERDPTRPFPIQIFFNPLTTSSKNPKSINFGGKKPVITAPMTEDTLALYKASPGRYYLRNLAYGFDYFVQGMQNQVDSTKVNPLEIQGQIYTGFRLKRDFSALTTAIQSWKSFEVDGFAGWLKQYFGTTFARNFFSELGIGRLINPFITSAFNGNSQWNSIKSLTSKRTNVVRRSVARKTTYKRKPKKAR